jgi:hypothetical protein
LDALGPVIDGIAALILGELARRSVSEPRQYVPGEDNGLVSECPWLEGLALSASERAI